MSAPIVIGSKMPNVLLTKDDGLVLVLPADSITAVLTVQKAETAPPKNPKAKSLVFSTFRGLSIFFLDMTAREVFSAVAAKATAGRDWLELPAGDDASFIDPDSVALVEGALFPDKSPCLRVWFTRQDGTENFTDTEFSDDRLAQLSGLVGGGDSSDSEAAEPTPQRARPPRQSRR